MNNKIRTLRKEKKLSQKDLAGLIGVSASAIGMYEQGRRDPDTKTLLAIARALNVSVDYLIGASDIIAEFDVDTISKGITNDLLENPALMFSADFFTNQELEELGIVLEQTIKNALLQKLSPDEKDRKTEG